MYLGLKCTHKKIALLKTYLQVFAFNFVNVTKMVVSPLNESGAFNTRPLPEIALIRKDKHLVN